MATISNFHEFLRLSIEPLSTLLQISVVFWAISCGDFFWCHDLPLIVKYFQKKENAQLWSKKKQVKEWINTDILRKTYSISLLTMWRWFHSDIIASLGNVTFLSDIFRKIWKKSRGFINNRRFIIYLNYQNYVHVL